MKNEMKTWYALAALFGLSALIGLLALFGLIVAELSPEKEWCTGFPGEEIDEPYAKFKATK